MAEEITLENASTKAVFARDDGRLIRLTNKLTGWELIRRPELGMSFRLAVPLPGKRDNLVLGEDQGLTSHSLSADGKELTLGWEKVHSKYGGEHEIDFHGTVRVTDNGLEFTGKVINRSKLTVEVAAFPCLGDLAPSAADKQLVEFAPGGAVDAYTIELYPKFVQDKGYWGVDHLCQNRAMTPVNDCILLKEEDQGFYVGPLDADADHMIQFWFEKKPGALDSYSGLLPPGDSISGHTVALEAMVLHYVFVGPDAETKLAGVAVAAYQGSWHKGMDHHKAWREKWFRRPVTPGWVDDVHSWLQIQINGAEDNRLFKYKELPEIASECKDAGIEAIQLTGWRFGGQDRGNPCHDTDDVLGTREELIEAIRQCREMGVKIVLFCKFTWYDQTQPYYKTEGLRHVARDPYGDPYVRRGWQYGTWVQLTGINERRQVFTCNGCRDWRKTALREFKKAADLGAAGILYDEAQHHGPAIYCFADDHGHPVPAFNFYYDNLLVQEFKEYSDETDPDFLYAGENCNERQMLEYHLAYTRFSKGSRHVRRYVAPWEPIMMAVTGFDDRNQINKCLQYRYIMSYEPFNFKGRPSDAPLTLAYGRKVDDLRRLYREYLWDGEFRDGLGGSVSRDGEPYDDYTVFRNLKTDKHAVVVANIDHEHSISVAVAIEANDAATFIRVTPEEPDPQKTAGRIVVGPRSVAVLLEQ